LVVNATIASLGNSEVFEVNNEIVSTRNDSVFRAGKILNFECIVRDRYGNLRGDGYEDVVEMNVTLNHVNESMMSLFEQDPTTGHYMNSYEFTGVGTYRVYFYLNGFEMPFNYTFQTINDVLSPSFTETKFLGYLQYAEPDCVFVNRHFYVVFKMRDRFNNVILYNDTFAFISVVRASLTNGIHYDLE
jgi:hypothetical protein